MTKKEAAGLAIDDLVSKLVKAAGDVALNQAGTAVKVPNAEKDLRILSAEMRSRLHSGKRAQELLTEYQARS